MHPTRRSVSPRHAISPRFTWTTLAPAWLGVALLACASCSTEEIAPNEIALTATRTDAGQGYLLIALAEDSDTYEQDQAKILQSIQEGSIGVGYEIYIDGKRLIDDNGGMPWPLAVGEGSESGCGYLPAGNHHFALVSPSDGHDIFAADYEILSGQVNLLYVFGHLAALQGVFTSYPYAPPTGMQHVSLVNLLRTGQSLEVVSCSGGDPETCTTISPPVAYGESFDGDFPGPDLTGWGPSFEPPGPGLGYRQIATPSVPSPPAIPLFLGAGGPLVIGTPTFINGEYLFPATYVIAPIFMSPAGDTEAAFN